MQIPVLLWKKSLEDGHHHLALNWLCVVVPAWRAGQLLTTHPAGSDDILHNIIFLKKQWPIIQ
jgi:hypothetical protein